MYQDRTRSKQAKLLREHLHAKGFDLGHAQCLELLAKLEGHRTLHVANAAPGKELVVEPTARAQAAVVMFDSLGAYEGQLEKLMQDLREMAKLQDAALADKAFRRIFRQERPVQVSMSFSDLRAEEIPTAFDNLVAKLRGSLLKSAGMASSNGDVLFTGRICDWEKAEGVLADSDERTDYDACITRSGSQFYIDIAPAGQGPDSLAGKPQLSLFVEVNHGVPCVHISNDLGGDQVLTVSALSAGLYLRPDAIEHSIRTGVPSAGTDLAAHHQWETQPPFGARMSLNHAFIESSNAN